MALPHLSQRPVSAQDALTTFDRLWRDRAPDAPRPEKNYHFLPGRGFRFARAWPDAGIACEFSARGPVMASQNDLDKYNAAARLGWVVFRFTDALLAGDPEGCVDQVRASLARAGHDAGWARVLDLNPTLATIYTAPLQPPAIHPYLPDHDPDGTITCQATTEAFRSVAALYRRLSEAAPRCLVYLQPREIAYLLRVLGPELRAAHAQANRARRQAWRNELPPL